VCVQAPRPGFGARLRGPGAVATHLSGPGRVVALQRFRLRREGGRPAEAEEPLEGRLEPGSPVDEEVEPLPNDRDETELVLVRQASQAERRIGLAVEHGDCRVGLRTSRGRQVQVGMRQAVSCEELVQEHLTAGLRLPRGDALPAQIGDATNPGRTVRRHDQTAVAPGKLDQRHWLGAEAAPNQWLVPGISLRCVQVQARRHALALGETLHSVEAAIQVSGETGARLPQCPFEQRVVAAEQDVRALDGGAGHRPRAAPGNPGRDGQPRKQQLARGARARDLARGRELVDLALLDAKQLGELSGRQKFVARSRHGCGAARRRQANERILPQDGRLLPDSGDDAAIGVK